MHRIPENFNGYLEIDGAIFTYHVSKTIVTLFPAFQTPTEQYACINNLLQKKGKLPQFVCGSYQGYQVIFFINSEIIPSMMEPSCCFATSMIIKAAGNADGFYAKLSEHWGRFHSITFYGGNINFLHDPLNIIDNKASLNDKYRRISIKDQKEYTHKIKCMIDDEEVELTISIQDSTKIKDNENTLKGVSIGNLNSFIRLTFTAYKDFSSISKYASLIRKLISFLTIQSNVFCNIYLSQKDKDGLLYKTADCKIFDSYQNYATNSWPSVIRLTTLKRYLPTLIAKLNEHAYDSIFDVLPKNNTEIHKISIYNIQNLCSTLESVYKFKNAQRSKDSDIERLKADIKKTISEFIKNNPTIDVYSKTNISSAFQYLDFTLKDKIITLYEEYKEILDTFCSEKNLPEITYEKIGSFVKLRNQKTHNGVVELDDSALLYRPLFVLSYICIFDDLSLSIEDINYVVHFPFSYIW